MGHPWPQLLSARSSTCSAPRRRVRTRGPAGRRHRARSRSPEVRSSSWCSSARRWFNGVGLQVSRSSYLPGSSRFRLRASRRESRPGHRGPRQRRRKRRPKPPPRRRCLHQRQPVLSACGSPSSPVTERTVSEIIYFFV